MEIINVSNLDNWINRIDNTIDYNRYIYPNFYDWKERIYNNLGINRYILLAVDDSENILGISILKKDPIENKICTFLVLEKYRNNGIGTKLMSKSLEVLNDNHPMITIPDLPEHDLDLLIRFIMRFDFKFSDLISYGNRCELVFNKSSQSSILLSIKPIYSDQIFNGTKKVEFRKRSIPNKKVVVYSSSPVKSISGYFTIKEIDCDTPENLWNKYHSVGGISKEDFFNYYSGRDKGYAIVIDRLFPLTIGRSIIQSIGIKNIMRNFTAPQFYKYL